MNKTIPILIACLHFFQRCNKFVSFVCLFLYSQCHPFLNLLLNMHSQPDELSSAGIVDALLLAVK